MWKRKVEIAEVSEHFDFSHRLKLCSCNFRDHSHRGRQKMSFFQYFTENSILMFQLSKSMEVNINLHTFNYW